MRKILFALSAVSLTLPASFALPTSAAQARHHYRHYERGYHHVRRCSYSGGTTGLVAGGVGGALVGNSILGHGALGTIAGGVGGALAGRAIDRSITAHRRCR
ncbi:MULTISPECIES: hypothetical protein [unclassified Sphingomonas]|jgi:outer membrane lipoprotein SlyB|uniref:hypothetical protein n=1 Tax=unclassified Sphingomonas TaxID=196159 RepID=UPI000E108731|nr:MULTISPECIES: hypothetical protein [unclassified Sphingomonas]AXJ95245.1 hypothetical protein DM480_06715 [Sphingomonas sp. FARSPH]